MSTLLMEMQPKVCAIVITMMINKTTTVILVAIATAITILIKTKLAMLKILA